MVNNTSLPQVEAEEEAEVVVVAAEAEVREVVVHQPEEVVANSHSINQSRAMNKCSNSMVINQNTMITMENITLKNTMQKKYPIKNHTNRKSKLNQ